MAPSEKLFTGTLNHNQNKKTKTKTEKTAFPMMGPLYETRRENLFKRLVKALIYQSDQGLHSSFA